MTEPPRSPRSKEWMSGRSVIIPVELFIFGVLGMVAPYLGRPLGLVLDVRPVTEVVDHVVPGAAVVAVALAAIVIGRRWFVASMVVVAAGLWMTASHLPLLFQAGNGQADLGAAVFHAAPGMVILVLGSVASVVDARAERDEDDAPR